MKSSTNYIVNGEISFKKYRDSYKLEGVWQYRENEILIEHSKDQAN